MVYVADSESWQRIFHLVEERAGGISPSGK